MANGYNSDMYRCRNNHPGWLSGLALLLLGSLLSCDLPAKERSYSPMEGGASPSRVARWSDTRPAINLTHLFSGEINRRGRPVGFHSRPGGADPAGSGIVRVIDRPNRVGVYSAVVWIGRRSRTKRSTFFPDRLTRSMVVQAILVAHRLGRRHGEFFRGPSGHGFAIEGYVQDGRINTAYPIYRR